MNFGCSQFGVVPESWVLSCEAERELMRLKAGHA